MKKKAKKTRKVTLESLTATMQAGFTKVNSDMQAGFTKVNKDIETLAQITAKGFENTANEIGGLKSDVKTLKSDVQTLQTDVSDIKLRLDNLAPKFEVRDLEKRVVRLETKAGIRHTA